MPGAGGGARHGSVISARLVPAQTPPIVCANWHQYHTTCQLSTLCSTMRASVPSGGVQLGVGELVSALAAPSPLIAGANTILAIYFHFPILTSSCPCRSLCRLQASAASWTPPTSPRGSSSSGGAVEATSDMSCWEARSSIRR